MASTLLYMIQPSVKNLPPEVPPGSLAWFGRWSSGHLCHVDQAMVDWAAEQGIFAKSTEMGYDEYQRLLAESHWYEEA
jgi:hypothetical protein